MDYIQIEENEDHILVITIDCPDTKVNKVSSGLLDEISTALKERINGEDVKGVAIVSAKEDNFIVGADIDELQGMKDEKEVVRYIEKAHHILNQIETLPIPVVCGIHGNCLGGGLELALVADYRIASDSTSTVMGLPEVQLGLLPAAGGTQRLPRLIPLKDALPMMLTAKNLRVKMAKKLGLIDEITNPYVLKDAVVQKTLELSKNGFERKRKKRTLIDLFLESTAMGKRMVFKKARAGVMKQTHGLYPAPPAIIDSVELGYEKGVEEGLRTDIPRFGELVMSSQSKSLINLFFGMTDLKKNPHEEKAVKVDKLAILGAGLMGSGIALVSTALCETTILMDISLEAAAKGMKDVSKSLKIKARSGSISPFERDVMYGKIVPCEDYSLFKNTNLVIEAVFEDLDLKRKILRDVENATDEKTIFASNTSALPISSIAEGAMRPENIIGMHYFSPVHSMPLLEIITTDKTADWVTATVLDFGIRQGKTCIVVKDGPGFYTTRILGPLLNEAVLLIEEGAEIHAIDEAMLLSGYPVGPVALLDEVGIDVGAHVSEGLGKLFEARGAKTSDGLRKLFQKGYQGKKNKKGFYRYDKGKKNGMRRANTEVYRILGDVPRKKMGKEEIQYRVSLMMVNEAVRCLEEGIISSPRDGDVGAILGLGFPPFRGGPFRYVDSEGASSIVEMMEHLRKKHGPRFTPADLLVDMASGNKTFHASS